MHQGLHHGRAQIVNGITTAFVCSVLRTGSKDMACISRRRTGLQQHGYPIRSTRFCRRSKQCASQRGGAQTRGTSFAQPDQGGGHWAGRANNQQQRNNARVPGCRFRRVWDVPGEMIAGSPPTSFGHKERQRDPAMNRSSAKMGIAVSRRRKVAIMDVQCLSRAMRERRDMSFSTALVVCMVCSM